MIYVSKIIYIIEWSQEARKYVGNFFSDIRFDMQETIKKPCQTGIFKYFLHGYLVSLGYFEGILLFSNIYTVVNIGRIVYRKCNTAFFYFFKIYKQNKIIVIRVCKSNKFKVEIIHIEEVLTLSIGFKFLCIIRTKWYNKYYYKIKMN